MPVTIQHYITDYQNPGLLKWWNFESHDFSDGIGDRLMNMAADHSTGLNFGDSGGQR
jgi:hypothetical protein